MPEARFCTSCGAPFSPAARFCHRCGSPRAAAPAGNRQRLPWLVAGVLIITGVSWITLKGINRNAPAARPDMANVGSAAPGVGSAPPGDAPGTPPDISAMSPGERFNRLYDRVMRTAAAGNDAEARQFVPMALMAYSQLDTVNADLRYHAAVLYAEAGRYPEALALADTILAENPGHLFGYLVRAEVADRQSDPAAGAAARREFSAAYGAEITRPDRPEYTEHRSVIEEMKKGGEAGSTK